MATSFSALLVLAIVGGGSLILEDWQNGGMGWDLTDGASIVCADAGNCDLRLATDGAAAYRRLAILIVDDLTVSARFLSENGAQAGSTFQMDLVRGGLSFSYGLGTPGTVELFVPGVGAVTSPAHLVTEEWYQVDIELHTQGTARAMLFDDSGSLVAETGPIALAPVAGAFRAVSFGSIPSAGAASHWDDLELTVG